MPNSRPHDHLTDHNWQLEIEGVTQGAFAEVSGLDSETELHGRGGDERVARDAASGLPTGKIVVTLTRGYVDTDELWTWKRQQDGGRGEARSVTLVRRDGDRTLRYQLHGARPLVLEGRAEEIGVLKLALERIERTATR